MSKILITGGAGFIGSHIAEKLGALGHEVIILDNLDPYYSPKIKSRNLELVQENPNIQFIEGDILDRNILTELIKGGVEYIYHEAAQPGVRASLQDPFKPYRVNVGGTLNILEAAKEGGVKRIINASSSSVYGNVEYMPFDEGHPTRPLSPYGVSKLTAEYYCNVYHNLYELPVVTLRYFTVYGPRMRPDLAIPLFASAMLQGKSPTIFGDGTQSRDFTFIDDIVAANVNLLDTDKADGEVLNIGAGREIVLKDVYDSLLKLVDSDVEPIYAEEIKGDAKHTLSKVDKARELIGYKPETTIEVGLKKFVEWYKANRSFYSD
ncbi:MAG: SDR family oxidoreductase [Thermoplasmata archaeon]|nr:MAG: SDR family oxidoreductase [Thermoplasmata archaeon]